MSPMIAPSILASDFSRLGEEVRAVVKAGADMIHVDVMDGHFVPNMTIGPTVVKSLRKVTDKPFDVHLMIEPIETFIPMFAEAGADIISIHPEAGPHLHRALQLIKSLGKKCGVAMNPATPLEHLAPVIDDIDLVLMMSVNPGFGGQKFIPGQLARIAAVRRMIDDSGRDIILEVDGGVNAETVGAVIEAGATSLVAGSAVFTGDAADYADNIAMLRHGG